VRYSTWVADARRRRPRFLIPIASYSGVLSKAITHCEAWSLLTHVRSGLDPVRDGHSRRGQVHGYLGLGARVLGDDDRARRVGAHAGHEMPAGSPQLAASLLWMNGVPSEQLERMVMQHYFDRNAIGPIRAVASRTQDIIGAVLDMAAVIHPGADLARLANLLPVQLELGIPADLAPIALAGAGLTSENYLNLIAAD
jgi:hypothetical protein